ncbi:lactonase family protein [Flavobacteriaceae bacterium SZ-1-7]|uniref:lactonase family protein n=1 Tax=Tamlana sedimenti TaxID=3134126 RepID=UPI00312AEB34
MKPLSAFLFTLISLNLANCQNTPLYVGTYTDGDSEGIYQVQFSTKTGALSNLKLATTISNPSYIAYSPDKRFLYAVDEGENGTVSAFKIMENGTLAFINREKTFGGAPCHISVNNEGNKLVASNYKGGNISLYDINADGSLNVASQVFDHNTDDEKSHAHSAQFFEDNLFVSDLGRNALYQYKLKESKYELESPAIIETKGNPGPRHFTITANGTYIYVINEYGCSITSIEKTDSGFKQIDEDSTLDENYKGYSSCADIHLSKDERFLYGSNRGENSIAVFKRNKENGTLEKIQNISVHGDWPRNFTPDPTGKFLLVANRKSNNISVFSINSSNGKLNFLHDFKAPTPVCLLF